MREAPQNDARDLLWPQEAVDVWQRITSDGKPLTYKNACQALDKIAYDREALKKKLTSYQRKVRRRRAAALSDASKPTQQHLPQAPPPRSHPDPRPPPPHGTYSVEEAEEVYARRRLEVPTSICSCCHKLKFPRAITSITAQRVSCRQSDWQLNPNVTASFRGTMASATHAYNTSGAHACHLAPTTTSTPSQHCR